MNILVLQTTSAKTTTTHIPTISLALPKIVKVQENPHYHINFQIINFLETFGHSSCPEGDLAKECLIC